MKIRQATLFAATRYLTGMLILVLGMVCSLPAFSQGEDQKDKEFFNSGLTKAKAGQLNEAIADFTESIKIAEKRLAINTLKIPVNYKLPEGYVLDKAYYYRSVAQASLGNKKSAVEDLGYAIAYNINYKEAYILRAKVCNDIGEYTTALTNLKVAVVFWPDNFDIHYHLGVARFNIGNNENVVFNKPITVEAAENFSKAISLKPQDASAMIHRAKCFIKLEKYDEALADLNKVIEADKKNADAYYYRGILYRYLENYEMAILDYNVSIQIDPTNSSAYYNRAISYSKMDEHQKAVQDFTKAIELFPEDDKAYLNRGIEYLILDKTEDACRDFKKAADLNNQAAKNNNLDSICQK